MGIFLLFVVVGQEYEIQVNDAFVISGNSAVFKCEMPPYTADYLSVTSWLTSDGVARYPDEGNYGNFTMS